MARDNLWLVPVVAAQQTTQRLGNSFDASEREKTLLDCNPPASWCFEAQPSPAYRRLPESDI